MNTTTTDWTPNAEGAFEMPPEAYFKAPGVSNSMLKNIVPTPAHLQAYLLEDHDPTPEMMLGTLAHHWILTPDVPLPKLAIKPAGMKFSTREGMAWRAEAQKAGKLIVPEADFEALKAMTKNVSLHPVGQQLLSSGRTEVSCFGRPGSFGPLRKARLDFVPDANVLCDLKTSVDASKRHFEKDLVDMGYACQAAYYLDLWNYLFPDDTREGFVFFVAEKSPPYLVACYQVSTDALEWARGENAIRLLKYAECEASGVWPGYPVGPEIINLPRWVMRNKEPE